MLEDFQMKQEETLYVPYHRLELLTITPLSMENASVGSPAIFQALILTGSPKVFTYFIKTANIRTHEWTNMGDSH